MSSWFLTPKSTLVCPSTLVPCLQCLAARHHKLGASADRQTKDEFETRHLQTRLLQTRHLIMVTRLWKGLSGTHLPASTYAA
jgi:hypothetical protein